MNWVVAYITGLTTSVVVTNALCLLFNSLNKTIAYVSLLVGFIVFLFVVIRYSEIPFGFEKKDFNFWSLFTIFML